MSDFPDDGLGNRDFAAVVRLEKELTPESDRGAILVAGAMLDDALRDVLIAKLAPNPSSQDTLFDSLNGPMHSFSAKIDMAYRLGVVSAKFSRDLHLIRKMRNDVAHAPSGCTFADPAIANRVDALVRSHGIYRRSPKWAATQKNGHRDQFIETASWMLFSLTSGLNRVQQIAERQPEFGYNISLDDESEDGVQEKQGQPSPPSPPGKG